MTDRRPPSAEEVRRRFRTDLEAHPEPPPPDEVMAETDLEALRVCVAVGVHHGEGRVTIGRVVGRCQRCGFGLAVTP